MIRTATLDDVPHMVELTRHYFPRLKNTDAHFDARAFESYATAFVTSAGETSVALVSERNGALAAFVFCVLMPSPLTGEIVAVKCLWEAREDARGHGVKVHKAAEDWAVSRGVRRFLSSCFDEAAAGLLRRMGFNEIEHIFEKVLA